VLLGMFPVEVADRTDALGPGDALVLYTDGVIEARREHELFGEAGLQAVLARPWGSADEIADAVLAATFEYAGALEDDVAILVVRRNAPVTP
jgi:sigma-B regulation protein RsbU (phosphoserine phosphatase)